jgi:hypothetical protein
LVLDASLTCRERNLDRLAVFIRYKTACVNADVASRMRTFDVVDALPLGYVILKETDLVVDGNLLA